MKDYQQINRLLDGELTPAEHAEWIEAVENDPELRAHFKELQKLGSLHRTSMPEDKDADFIDQELAFIHEAIAQTPQEKDNKLKILSFPTAWIPYAAGLAAALALGFTVLWQSPWNVSPNDFPEAGDRATIAYVETDIVGASSMIFMDENSGWTFVWVDEPELG